MIADLQHMPITLRNESVCREWYEKLKNYTQANIGSMMALRVTEAMRTWPDILDFLDPDGRPKRTKLYERTLSLLKDNAEYRQEIVDENKALSEAPKKRGQKIKLRDVPKAMTVDEARQIATDGMQAEWESWLADNTQCAKVLFFNVASYPVTLPAMRFGIACIKATVDRNAYSADILAQIDSDVTSDFWQDVTAHEVATYCDRFCGSVSGDVLVDLVGPAMADHKARTARQVRASAQPSQLPN